MVKKVTYTLENGKIIKDTAPTRAIITYSPSLRKLPDLGDYENKFYNKYYTPRTTPLYEIWDDDYQRRVYHTFSKKKSLEEGKIQGRVKANHDLVIDRSGIPVYKKDVERHRFYAVEIPINVINKKYKESIKKLDSQKRVRYYSGKDRFDALQDIYAPVIAGYARHKRVTKGKKSRRS